MLEKYMHTARAKLREGIKASLTEGSTHIEDSKPLPFGATEAQELCAIAAEIVYLADVIECLKETDEKERTRCLLIAADTYCTNFDACFPE